MKMNSDDFIISDNDINTVHDGQNVRITDDGWVRRYLELSRKLLSDSMKNNEDENLVCSPFSLYMLLETILLASCGDTYHEILKIMGDGNNEKQIHAVFSAFQKCLSETSNLPFLVSSNAICLREDLMDNVNLAFRQEFQQTYNGEIFSVDENLLDNVNDWVSKRTNGMIPLIFTDIPNEWQMMIMNAVTFQAGWWVHYDDEDIVQGKFYNDDGMVSNVDMMCSMEYAYIENDYFTGFQKNYEDCVYSFIALLPKKKKSKSFLEHALKQVNFQECARSCVSTMVNVKIPEFETHTEISLKEFLLSIGMKEAFDDKNDFGRIVNDRSIKLDNIIQKTAIKVNRIGTEAAAATLGVVVAGCAYAEKEVILNRPFIYSIVHEKTGLPVFTGVVSKL